MGGVATAVAHAGGRRVGWLAPIRLGGGGLELGEILAGSSGSDAVTPAGAIIPPWRVSAVFIPLYPPRAGGNPRTRPGSSVVGVAFLPGGAAWYSEDRSLGSWWVDFGGRSGCRSFASVELPVLALFLLLFLSLVVLLAPAFAL